jgi:hypothetical protein
MAFPLRAEPGSAVGDSNAVKKVDPMCNASLEVGV